MKVKKDVIQLRESYFTEKTKKLQTDMHQISDKQNLRSKQM